MSVLLWGSHDVGWAGGHLRNGCSAPTPGPLVSLPFLDSTSSSRASTGFGLLQHGGLKVVDFLHGSWLQETESVCN